jgi:hypothetical protein
MERNHSDMKSERLINITNNQAGEISFLGITIAIFSLSLWSIVLLKHISSLNNLKVRTDKHLCFKYLLKETEHYQQRIAHLNKVIQASYYISLIPATRVQARLAINLAQNSQFFLDVSYLKKVFTHKHCQATSAIIFIKNNPYEKKGIFPFNFRRNLDGTTKLKKNNWKFTYYLYPLKVWEEKIELSYSSKSSSDVPTAKIFHIMSKGSRLFRQFYGRQSY